MSRVSAPDRRQCAGFTIVEVLVALVVMATSLAAIGSVAAANARASRTLDQRAGLLQTARAVEAGIPRRSDLALGETEGEIGGHRWRMEVRPLAVDDVPADAQWVPRSIVIRVRAPSGASVTLETVRLARSATP